MRSIMKISLPRSLPFSSTSSFIYPSSFSPFSTSTSTSSSSSPSSWSDFKHVKRVGVIGGGVAGLQAARALAASGYEVTIFEKSPTIGGVWRSNYSTFGLQVPKQLYEFPDFAFQSQPAGSYPTGPQVQEYIEAYAAHFGLSKFVKTNTAVTSVTPRANGARGWTFTTTTQGGNKQQQQQEFDFAVVATGMYSKPNMPTFPGQEEFLKGNDSKKQIIHAVDFTNASIAQGKQVVVIGGAKSAIDCALAAASTTVGKASKTTFLFRQAHWGTPRKIAGLIPFQYVFLSRFGQALVSWYKGALPVAPTSVKAAHSALSIIMGPIFGIVEALFSFQLNQSGNRKPVDDVVKDFYGFANVLDSSLKNAMKDKSVEPVKGAISKLTAEGAVLEDGRILPADIIVAGTGYTKNYDYFAPAVRKALNPQDDGLWLYRHMISSQVPDLAFIGSEVATISNITTHGVQSEWLSRVLKGEVKLPSSGEMQAAVDEHQRWARNWMPYTSSRASLVLLHQIHYHDALLKDMKVSHRRKGANVLAEIFAPYQPADYNGILKY